MSWKPGVTKYGQNVLAVPALTKDGRRISVEFNVALLKDCRRANPGRSRQHCRM